MAKYTIELGTMLQGLIGATEVPVYPKINSVIEQARPLVFDFDYPIFDIAYKKVLESKILRHYYFYEIGDTPYGKWKVWLEDTMTVKMPYFNQLYESQLLAFNPMYTVNFTRTYNRKNNRTANSSAEDNSTNSVNVTDSETVNNTNDRSNTNNANLKQMYSDTPQSVITDLETGKYLTNATINTNVVSDTGKDVLSGTTSRNGDTSGRYERSYRENEVADDLEDYSENFVGLQGKSGSQLLVEFRSTFLNIDEMVLGGLRDLFFMVF